MFDSHVKIFKKACEHVWEVMPGLCEKEVSLPDQNDIILVNRFDDYWGWFLVEKAMSEYYREVEESRWAMLHWQFQWTDHLSVGSKGEGWGG